MKKTLFTSVVLSAAAVGLVPCVNAVVSTPEWFDADIANYSSWPSDGTDKIVDGQGTWSGTAYATYDTDYSSLVVDAGTDKLTFAARDVECHLRRDDDLYQCHNARL